jgi:hypothetical protein
VYILVQSFKGTTPKYNFLHVQYLGHFQEEMQYIFIVKDLILINFLTVKISRYDEIDEFLKGENKKSNLQFILILYYNTADNYHHISLLHVRPPSKYT